VDLERVEAVELIYNRCPAAVTFKEMTQSCRSLALQAPTKVGRDVLDKLPEPINRRIKRRGGKGCIWIN
jgi:hypothetical protein